MNPTIYIMLVIFVGTIIQSSFGFGLSIIAMPLLAFVISLQTATPMLALVGLGSSTLIVITSWKKIDWKVTWQLVLASAIATPVGILLLLYGSEKIVKLILGLFLVSYGVYGLLPLQLPQLVGSFWPYIFGFFAGILGSAYNTNGPPVMLYGTLKHWEPEKFRANLNSFFLPTGIIYAFGHMISGLWTATVWRDVLYSLPLLVAGMWIGTQVNKRIDPKKFEKYLFLLIILMGILLVYAAIR
jgi:uncharacterized protein